MQNAVPRRNDGRIILHFDYDCFYAAVFERENPALKFVPLAVQQKQIIVTCNYEARRRGLYKLQLVREARQKCPNVIIVLGEDLTRFRNASKDNYNFLRSYTWSNKVERLGFDEVFMDVTDLIDYNVKLLNPHDPFDSFFHLDRNDPTLGFSYDASAISGHTYPNCADTATGTVALSDAAPDDVDDVDDLSLRLCLGSHLAQHLRHELEQQKGYTSTVGISTNKLISKLVGNVNKPKGQTTLVPPYHTTIDGHSNVNGFIDAHEIGEIPGIGFKMAQKIRHHVLGRPAHFDTGLVYGGPKEIVKVKHVRLLDGVGPMILRQILDGPGVPKDLPEKVWGLINGVDNAEVGRAKEVPQQISIEDSYIRLDQLPEVIRELKMLSASLIRRMRLDLTTNANNAEEAGPVSADDEALVEHQDVMSSRRWLAHPKSLRLSTRPRPPLNPDGTRTRTFARISKSANMPSFVFDLATSVGSLSERLVEEALMPLFRKLHPEKAGWNLSLVNLCATNMSLSASDSKDGAGRDIGRMFRGQVDFLKDWKVGDIDIVPKERPQNKIGSNARNTRNSEFLESGAPEPLDNQLQAAITGSEDLLPLTQASMNDEDGWDSGDNGADAGDCCKACGAIMPAFAMTAHERFHAVPE
ncbi:MAG: hypothetical protein Q9217_002710 [Psora testacea]